MTSRGAAKLRAWVVAHTQAALAEALTKRLGKRIHQGTISAWTIGRNVPRATTLAAIEAATGGAVRVADWTRESRAKAA